MTRPQVAWVALAMVAVVLVLAMVLLAQLVSLHQRIDHACAGVVAQLDLTEWVELCRK